MRPMWNLAHGAPRTPVSMNFYHSRARTCDSGSECGTERRAMKARAKGAGLETTRGVEDTQGRVLNDSVPCLLAHVAASEVRRHGDPLAREVPLVRDSN